MQLAGSPRRHNQLPKFVAPPQVGGRILRKGFAMNLSRTEIEGLIKKLLCKYNAEYAILFGSYARDEADENSDIDVIVFGGSNFRATDIFAFGEELRELSRKNADVFEIREVDKDTEFYRSVMREGVRIA